MTDHKKQSNQLSDFLREKADVTISDLDHPGGLNAGEVLALRHWFADRQRQLKSSGGRPTNPRWTMKRQIPVSRDTWDELNKRAEACTEPGAAVGPGQVAAFVLEEALARRAVTVVDDPAPVVADPDNLNRPADDPQFDEWDSPAPFFAVAA